jgi:transcriptional regulator with XRE-family HTH domain
MAETRAFSPIKLRNLRVKQGLPRGVVANHVGVTVAAIGQWENRNTVPRIDKLPLLASALGCKIDDLFE